MKIIKNNVCYVELSDIEFLGALPNNILQKRQLVAEPNIFTKFEKFTDEESIKFFKDKEFILDYDTISILSDEELENEIVKTKNELNKLAEKILNSSSILNSKYHRTRIERDTNINCNIKNLKHILDQLTKYKNIRSYYDINISNLTFEQTNENCKIIKPSLL